MLLGVDHWVLVVIDDYEYCDNCWMGFSALVPIVFPRGRTCLSITLISSATMLIWSSPLIRVPIRISICSVLYHSSWLILTASQLPGAMNVTDYLSRRNLDQALQGDPSLSSKPTLSLPSN